MVFSFTENDKHQKLHYTLQSLLEEIHSSFCPRPLQNPPPPPPPPQISSSLMAAGSDSSSSSSSETSLYEDAVKLVKRAGKFEKKEKTEKAKNFTLKLLIN